MYWTTSDYSVGFPYNKLYIDVNMVSNAYSIYNGKYISSVSYYYNDAVAHRQGLGFCGFRKIRIYDNNRGIQTEQTFDPMKFGSLLKWSLQRRNRLITFIWLPYQIR